ncbi:MAG: hypothetical protein ACSI46_00570 [Gloeotrichia echinulata DVL01]|jgi:hypothetical protein|nr:hypothetical protein [Gloeotrichia echinulata DEX184]
MIYYDPYHPLGLKSNPFISEEIDELIETSWIDRGLSQSPPVRAKLFVQLQGAEGAGKTSHLLYWQKQTEGLYVSYPPERMGYKKQRWRIPPIGDIAYWDEAQAIPVPLLLFALGQAAIYQSTIVVATHADLSWAAQSLGLRVETITLPLLDSQTLLKWAQLRIQLARLSNTKEVRLHLTPAIAEQILAQSRNSWRSAATHLHIWVAKNATTWMNKT